MSVDLIFGSVFDLAKNFVSTDPFTFFVLVTVFMIAVKLLVGEFYDCGHSR